MGGIGLYEWNDKDCAAAGSVKMIWVGEGAILERGTKAMIDLAVNCWSARIVPLKSLLNGNLPEESSVVTICCGQGSYLRSQRQPFSYLEDILRIFIIIIKIAAPLASTDYRAAPSFP